VGGDIPPTHLEHGNTGKRTALAAEALQYVWLHETACLAAVLRQNALLEKFDHFWVAICIACSVHLPEWGDGLFVGKASPGSVFQCPLITVLLPQMQQIPTANSEKTTAVQAVKIFLGIL
jgi:hypothetical protein